MSDDESQSHTGRMFYWALGVILLFGVAHELSLGQAGEMTDWRMLQYSFGTLIMFLLMGIGMELHEIRKEVAE